MTHPKPTDPEAPAIIRGDHVQDRNLFKGAGKKGWRKKPAHERAFELGHLLCKERWNIPAQKQAEIEAAIRRRDAWAEFTEKWLICQASFPGFDPNRIRAVGIPGSFADHQIDTKRILRAVEAKLGARDWMLCRRVCGEDWSIALAVTAISPSYKFSTLARFRECLDSLIESLEATRRFPG